MGAYRLTNRDIQVESTTERERAREESTENNQQRYASLPGLPFVKCAVFDGLEKEPEERPEKKRKGRREFAPPTLDEVKEFFRERGYVVDPEAFYRAGHDSDWTRADGSKIKVWKLWAAQWENREREKQARLGKRRGPQPQAVSTAPPGFWENFNDIMAEKRRKLLEEVERKEREATNNGQSGNDSADVDARN